MRLSRRSLLVGAGGGALAGSGIYELVDRFAGSPSRSRSSSPPAVDHGEQHLLDGVREIVSDGVEVLAPSLHHEVVTATVKAGIIPLQGVLFMRQCLHASGRQEQPD